MTTPLEYCHVCRCAVLMRDHTTDECSRLKRVRSSIRVERYDASDVTIENISRIFERIVETMKEHERTCGLCSYWIKEDSSQRCGDYQSMREAKWKWGKKHDDAH
jgi:hypothetical protein